MDDCLRCKDYRECTQDRTWFHYGQIRWCPWQILWILTNAEELRAGKWPRDFKVSDNGAIGKRNIRVEATFAKPVIILAEVEYRLAMTGLAGKLLLAQIKAGVKLEIEKRKILHTFEPEAEAALMYIKGRGRKRLSFQIWLKQVRYRERNLIANLKYNKI